MTRIEEIQASLKAYKDAQNELVADAHKEHWARVSAYNEQKWAEMSVVFVEELIVMVEQLNLENILLGYANEECLHVIEDLKHPTKPLRQNKQEGLKA